MYWLLKEELKDKRHAERVLEKLYELKSGEQVGSIALNDIARMWDREPGRRSRSPRYIDFAHSVFAHFISFVRNNFRAIDTMADVTPAVADAFLTNETNRGVSARTWNSKLVLLRSVFETLLHVAGMSRNPFQRIPTKAGTTVHREPFTPEELKSIVDAADDFIRPIIVTGICTAMRRTDCCLLKKSSVDMKQGFVVVKTNKTGEVAEIPLFPLLRQEIETLPRSDSEYLFPEQAAMFQKNRSGITWRTRKVIKDAGLETQQERTDGKLKASVRDFHSFRTTWITLALSAGVPIELIKRVTGHKTVDVVLKHYFRPGREQFKNALSVALPAFITATEQEVLTMSGIHDELLAMNKGNWRSIRNKLVDQMSANA